MPMLGTVGHNQIMFLIGEFSQIAQVPKSQLRYYDEIGLLKPAEADKWTSYRFYSVKQLPVMALPDLGLSLDQINCLVTQSNDQVGSISPLKFCQPC